MSIGLGFRVSAQWQECQGPVAKESSQLFGIVGLNIFGKVLTSAEFCRLLGGRYCVWDLWRWL